MQRLYEVHEKDKETLAIGFGITWSRSWVRLRRCPAVRSSTQPTVKCSLLTVN
ncbi:hypothetical protein [Gloeothece citriformis]|uniref:hypothetical protein n=1 Tax=Gloeothece citriformis TaxID=2546356 RepID=UPI0002E1E80D|nr:hypothetical protein [Gloeothece citriformis]